MRLNRPIIHQGQVIKNSEDVRPLLKLSPLDINEFEKDTKEKVKEAAKEYGDEQFAKLIEKVKPKLKYYEQGYGDKLLFFRRVDRLRYDIVEEEKLRRARQEEAGKKEVKNKKKDGLMESPNKA